VVIPVAFFVLGNLAAPVLRFVGERAARSLRSHFLIRREGASASQDSGVVIPRETLARIVPGETTHAQVLHRCGPDAETRERMSAPHQRTLVYRGRQIIPHRRPIFGWLAHVASWDIEDHEVEITFEHEVVSDVQARVRRVRQANPEA
jgi:hypothetical protein